MAATRPSIMSEGATTSAPGPGVGDGHAGQQVQGGVVAHVRRLGDHAAVAVGGVLAEADVGDHEQVAASARMARTACCTTPSSA